MFSILLWWAAPLTAAVLAAIAISVARRVRTAREDMETMDRYQKARAALARAAGEGAASRAERTGSRAERAGGTAQHSGVGSGVGKPRAPGGRSQRASGRSQRD